jgi:hypothetical protein
MGRDAAVLPSEWYAMEFHLRDSRAKLSREIRIRVISKAKATILEGASSQLLVPTPARSKSALRTKSAIMVTRVSGLHSRTLCPIIVVTGTNALQ